MSDTQTAYEKNIDPNETFRAISQELDLTPRQIAYARSAGVTNSSEFFSYLRSSLGDPSETLYDTADLSERLMTRSNVAALMSDASREKRIDDDQFGATAPPGASFKINDTVPDLTDGEIAYLASFERGELADEEAVMPTVCGPWPVKNQGARGTCVSFAMSAAYELYLCSETSNQEDLSEQFLYWAIKHHNLDPWPNADGSGYKYAVDAIDKHGICDETVWPYNPVSTHSVSQDPPPPGATHAASHYATRQPRARSYSQKHGNARRLLNLLRQHNGVAIAMPVFENSTGVHNWGTRAAQTFGAVQNPGKGWIASSGHAVLCTGFVPDPLEALGGHFVIRNSWDTSWGYALPDNAYVGPEPGYGQLTASYVDRYLWETCVF